jgi:peroxiredoxin
MRVFFLGRLLFLGWLLTMCVTVHAEALRPWTGGATPALELAEPDGTVRRLADYRGKAVLVNFWATWCEPCRAEMPSMERLRQAMAGRPFAVLAVNVAESGRVARDFADKLPITFTVLLDRDGRVTRAWGARVLPASFLIDANGAIRYSYFGELDWSSHEVRLRIESLLPQDSQRASR